MDSNPDEAKVDLLCVFVHGFKGTDSTFGGFPERLECILGGSDNLTAKIECIVFPAYETKGELNAATERFVDWLTTTVVHKEVGGGKGGGAGKTKVVLCGHSMGGLLIADAAIAIADSRREKTAPLWPRIIACVAFDTPYYGLHPSVFKNSATKAVNYAQAAHQLANNLGLFGSAAASAAASPVATGQPDFKSKTGKELVQSVQTSTSPQSNTSSSKLGWGSWAPAALGAVVAGAAAGAAFYKKEELTSSLGWAGDHLKYVGTLIWDDKALRRRIDTLIAIRKESGVHFHNFYTLLPGTAAHPEPRTFINVPRGASEAYQYHSPNQNSLASDEVEAHTGMFVASTNDGFFELGLRTAEIIQQAIEEAKLVEKRDAMASMKNVDLDTIE